MTLQPNASLQGGKYIIKKLLGQGGFGITYLAEQTMLERKVAIKEFFMKELCERDESTSHVTLGTERSRELVNRFREKFVKEARNIARLYHPNIVRIHDIFEENGTAYYVMDYIEGESLADMVNRRGAIPEAEAIGYIKQAANALSYIHSKSMNHLDIKPSNLMKRGEDGSVVVIDFGVAKQYDSVTSEGTTTTPVGISKGYSPNEQYMLGGVQSFSPQSDVYALAATLFKLLTGNTPPEAALVIEDGVPKEELAVHNVSSLTISAIEAAMLSRRRRTQSVDLFLQSLLANPPASSPTSDEETVVITSVEIPGSRDEVDKADDVSSIDGLIRDEGGFRLYRVNGVEFQMRKVESGTFTMGVEYGFLGRIGSDDKAHTVTLTDDYYIGQTQVTQELWEAVMESNPSSIKGAKHPVEQVSWNDCQDFIKKLNEMTGQTFRLPTEAEWEYAARGGNRSQGYKYAGSNNLGDVAWYIDNSDCTTHDVTTKWSNELGLYDMNGNVWEWCSDWDDKNYNSSSLQTNPKGANGWSGRVSRGGSWGSYAKDCRLSIRRYYAPGFRRDFLGLRLALSE